MLQRIKAQFLSHVYMALFAPQSEKRHSIESESTLLPQAKKR
jgi:hypothetical protein